MNKKPIKLVAAGSILVLCLGTTVAVRAFFNRPGESALALIPADADAIIIEDLVPAPSQLVAFNHIRQAIAKSGDTKGEFNLIEAELSESELSSALHPYFGQSAAVAVYADMKGGMTDPTKAAAALGNTKYVGFASLTDAAAASAALKKHLTPTGADGHYVLKDGKVARIQDGYLEVATSTAMFAKVDAVRNGASKSVMALNAFKHVRSLEEPAANLKLYAKSPGSNNWGVICASVEDSGISVVGRGDLHMGKGAPHMHPVGASTLKEVPSGPYMLFALAQPSALAGAAGSMLGKYQNTIMSSLKGDLVVGLYPSQKPWAGIDLMLMFTSNNGATPANGFKILRKELNKSAGHGQSLFAKPVKSGDATYFPLGAQFSQMLSASKSAPIEGVNKDILLGDKSLAMATVGQNVFIATSQKLLKKAVAAAEGNGGSVAGDRDFAPFAGAVASKSQVIFDLSTPRIIAGIANTTTKSNKSAKEAANAIRIATHGNDIVSASGGMGADGSAHGRLFIPLNYDVLVQQIAKHS